MKSFSLFQTWVGGWMGAFAFVLAMTHSAVHAQSGAPTITTFSPAEGPAGTRVTISGTNLSSASAVEFAGVAASFILFNEEILAEVPAGALTGLISIATPGGTVSSAELFLVTDAQHPRITSFSPVSGRAGTQVIIQGDLLSGATSVRFDGMEASFNPGTDGSIIALVPTVAVSGFLSVTTAAGTATSQQVFTVNATPAPIIQEVSPMTGPAGSQVTITGLHLDATTTVRFGSVEAPFAVVDGVIQTVVPAGASTAPIHVVSSGGTSFSSMDFVVSAAGPPAITSLHPAFGEIGTQVTISIENISAIDELFFHETKAVFTVFGNLILTTVPAGASTGPIRLTTGAGPVASQAAFVVINPLAPEISHFEPSRGPAGTEVAIYGTRFDGVLSVQFDGVAADFQAVSPTEIRAIVPATGSSGAVRITTEKGSDQSGNMFFVPPSVLSFSPSGGAPGTPVTIHGSSLTGATAVNFGTAAATFQVISKSEIRAAVPDRATAGRITVVTPGGSSMSAQDFVPDLYTDLAISAAAFPTVLEVGALVRYSVLITNKGPIDATQVVLTSSLPPGLVFNFAIGGDCLDSNGTVTCQVGQIAAGESVSIRLFVEAVMGGNLVSRISVGAAEQDSLPADNFQELTLEVEGTNDLVALSVRKTEAGLELSWPSEQSHFVLETAPALDASWIPHAADPTSANGFLIIELPFVAPERFFRLRKE